MAQVGRDLKDCLGPTTLHRRLCKEHCCCYCLTHAISHQAISRLSVTKCIMLHCYLWRWMTASGEGDIHCSNQRKSLLTLNIYLWWISFPFPAELIHWEVHGSLTCFLPLTLQARTFWLLHWGLEMKLLDCQPQIMGENAVRGLCSSRIILFIVKLAKITVCLPEKWLMFINLFTLLWLTAFCCQSGSLSVCLKQANEQMKNLIKMEYHHLFVKDRKFCFWIFLMLHWWQ